MAASNDRLYKAHTKNLRAVDVALERVLRELNASLATGDTKTSDALLKTVLLLVGGWAENRLRKLVLEENGFEDDERFVITGEPSQIGSWQKALEIGFRKRYNLPNANLAAHLPITARARFDILLATIQENLRPIVETRNKLAHGQWATVLNSDNSDFNPETQQQINAENALTVRSKIRIIKYMTYIIHDLVVGTDAFERDFDKHFKNLENARADLTTRSYQAWLLRMQDKLARGKEKRNGHLTD